MGEQGDVPRLVMMCSSSSDLVSRRDKPDLLTDLIWHSSLLDFVSRRGREDEMEENTCKGEERENENMRQRTKRTKKKRTKTNMRKKNT